MKARPSHRPPTAVMTQVLRPDCEVIGKAEIHPYLGPGRMYGMAPCTSMFSPFALWWSQGTAWDRGPESSKKSGTVFAANDPVVHQWSKTSRRRHHLIGAGGLSIAPIPGLAAACQEDSAGARLGPFDGNDEGAAEAIFGPRHVVASIDGVKSVATLRFGPGGASGWGNFLVCSDPSDNPVTLATQTPNTVLLGMTAGDTASALVAVASRFVIDLAINALIDALTGKIVSRLMPGLVRLIERRFVRFARWVLRPLLEPLSDLAAGALSGLVKLVIKALRGGREFAADPSDGDDRVADLWDTYAVTS